MHRWGKEVVIIEYVYCQCKCRNVSDADSSSASCRAKLPMWKVSNERVLEWRG